MAYNVVFSFGDDDSQDMRGWAGEEYITDRR
jgi:hypothetical protein